MSGTLVNDAHATTFERFVVKKQTGESPKQGERVGVQDTAEYYLLCRWSEHDTGDQYQHHHPTTSGSSAAASSASLQLRDDESDLDDLRVLTASQPTTTTTTTTTTRRGKASNTISAGLGAKSTTAASHSAFDKHKIRSVTFTVTNGARVWQRTVDVAALAPSDKDLPDFVQDSNMMLAKQDDAKYAYEFKIASSASASASGSTTSRASASSRPPRSSAKQSQPDIFLPGTFSASLESFPDPSDGSGASVSLSSSLGLTSTTGATPDSSDSDALVLQWHDRSNGFLVLRGGISLPSFSRKAESSLKAFLRALITDRQQLMDQGRALRQERDKLALQRTEAVAMLDDVIEGQSSAESAMYVKFAAVLNAKKEEIRALAAQLEAQTKALQAAQQQEAQQREKVQALTVDLKELKDVNKRRQQASGSNQPQAMQAMDMDADGGSGGGGTSSRPAAPRMVSVVTKKSDAQSAQQAAPLPAPSRPTVKKEPSESDAVVLSSSSSSAHSRYQSSHPPPQKVPSPARAAAPEAAGDLPRTPSRSSSRHGSTATAMTPIDISSPTSPISALLRKSGAEVFTIGGTTSSAQQQPSRPRSNNNKPASYLPDPASSSAAPLLRRRSPGSQRNSLTGLADLRGDFDAAPALTAAQSTAAAAAPAVRGPAIRSAKRRHEPDEDDEADGRRHAKLNSEQLAQLNASSTTRMTRATSNVSNTSTGSANGTTTPRGSRSKVPRVERVTSIGAAIEALK
ncbi:hypothetical protein CAOG_02569 [Capsaspora owczarzaki ATCC 30864]|uniref:Uncharacterized protein n=1 Tax=Capsaspora owczarzaki (strain ATCC 30864) TaxID=595528 RepID=A0A0D2X1U8_CAPO3|nr:hypothetical protein CAOG_02569 [Capsaspora owczarzaki ATCC 30864]KJE91434.1 hypothetical protein CAOG_002569 [Capsaspora owczarzaki ATCC 30864]|eukprot:XP_004349319.1 hypothetical protein CAOG_02569 [Capsaspora owczarzaki ATCC 30864]